MDSYRNKGNSRKQFPVAKQVGKKKKIGKKTNYTCCRSKEYETVFNTGSRMITRPIF